MQRIELTDSQTIEIHCPFCGSLALSAEDFSQCEHTLYHASDEGFEYVSSKLSFDVDVDLDEKTIDEYTNEIEYPNAVKIAIFQPAPSFFGGYVAFSEK